MFQIIQPRITGVAIFQCASVSFHCHSCTRVLTYVCHGTVVPAPAGNPIVPKALLDVPAQTRMKQHPACRALQMRS